MRRHVCIAASGFFCAMAVCMGLPPDQPGASAPADTKVVAPATADRAVSRVRMGIVKAKARLLAGQIEAAAGMIVDLLDAVDALPPGVEREPLVKALDDLLEQAAVRAVRGRSPVASDMGPPSAGDEPAPPGEEVLGNVGDYPSEAEAIDHDEARYRYEGRLRRSNKSDEADELARIGESRRIPSGALSYPPNWSALSERRKKHDGVMYRSAPFRNKDGETVQTVIYDVGELLFDAPEFTDSIDLDLADELRDLQDRDALRQRSEIFRGRAAELEAGIPLLQLFGGVTELRARTNPRGHRREEMLRVIQSAVEARRDVKPANPGP